MIPLCKLNGTVFDQGFIVLFFVLSCLEIYKYTMKHSESVGVNDISTFSWYVSLQVGLGWFSSVQYCLVICDLAASSSVSHVPTAGPLLCCAGSLRNRQYIWNFYNLYILKKKNIQYFFAMSRLIHCRARGWIKGAGSIIHPLHWIAWRNNNRLHAPSLCFFFRTWLFASVWNLANHVWRPVPFDLLE